jgi:hypothetical protein
VPRTKDYSPNVREGAFSEVCIAAVPKTLARWTQLCFCRGLSLLC